MLSLFSASSTSSAAESTSFASSSRRTICHGNAFPPKAANIKAAPPSVSNLKDTVAFPKNYGSVGAENDKTLIASAPSRRCTAAKEVYT
jgi:hypothetical protein